MKFKDIAILLFILDVSGLSSTMQTSASTFSNQQFDKSTMIKIIQTDAEKLISEDNLDAQNTIKACLYLPPN